MPILLNLKIYFQENEMVNQEKTGGKWSRKDISITALNLKFLFVAGVF